MMRLILVLASFMLIAGDALAQQRARPGEVAMERPGPGAAQCRIAEIVFARDGAGFVCDMGSDGRVLMATDGGTRPGGISAFMSWLIETDGNQTSARATITVNYEAADAATQSICDASGLRGASARSPITCYRILAVID
jgi:hypothetical protein